MEENEETEGQAVRGSSKRFTLSTRSPRYSRYSKAISKFEIPTIDTQSELQLLRLCRRHKLDDIFIGDFNDDEFDNENVYIRKHADPDARDIAHESPSYSKFKQPLQAECLARYAASARKYNRQFKNEISKLIDYQCSALEAAYLVRVTAYTTLWPPYHNETEITNTSRKFYRLTTKEQKRLEKITGMPYSKHF
ncbi:uncharacterized protein LOC117897081 [Drosophila subobscura]|uniref:uncharacterized protein LOC117897081 n=1 Tax=Drosophila subobscura TaxID=7241 RepID=UPI00155AB691|nr:uncharacterized protein LOC117897081 [Drosophila subobscura]